MQLRLFYRFKRALLQQFFTACWTMSNKLNDGKNVLLFRLLPQIFLGSFIWKIPFSSVAHRIHTPHDWNSILIIHSLIHLSAQHFPFFVPFSDSVLFRANWSRFSRFFLFLFHLWRYIQSKFYIHFHIKIISFVLLTVFDDTRRNLL